MFAASEPLAYALLALLERGLEWPDGGTRELSGQEALGAFGEWGHANLGLPRDPQAAPL